MRARPNILVRVLHENHPDRKYKGRVVFGGNDVQTQNKEVAMFQEMASCPATLEASASADCYGIMEGNSVEQADAKQAYVQARLRGTRTVVRLPKRRWPKHWHGVYIDPVCPLELALYGHPQSGGFWEEHAEKNITEEGFNCIPEWKSCYWHHELRVLLVLYVDDFKLAGPTKNLPVAWEKIRRNLNTGDPQPLDHFQT